MSRQNTVFKNAYNRCLGLLEAGRPLPAGAELCARLGVSRTTVGAILAQLAEVGLIGHGRRMRLVLRPPSPDDFFPATETDALSDVIERTIAVDLLGAAAPPPGGSVNELELARRIGVGTTSVREALIRFRRFGLIDKRANRQWVWRGVTCGYVEELCAVAEALAIVAVSALAERPADDGAWAGLAAIGRRYDAALPSADVARVIRIEADLRRLLLEAAANRFADDFFEMLALVRQYRPAPPSVGAANAAARCRAGLALVAALGAGDRPGAAAACRALVALDKEELLAAVGAAGSPLSPSV